MTILKWLHSIKDENNDDEFIRAAKTGIIARDEVFEWDENEDTIPEEEWVPDLDPDDPITAVEQAVSMADLVFGEREKK